jgi:hypothetical protein
MSQYDTVFEKNDGVSDLFKMFFFQVDFWSSSLASMIQDDDLTLVGTGPQVNLSLYSMLLDLALRGMVAGIRPAGERIHRC